MSSPITAGKAFLGVGWGFPLRAAPDGEVETAAYEEDIRQAIRIILGTRRGERVMRPDFGAGLHELVFAPLNQTTIERARHRVEEALTLWEPRIDQVAVTATTDLPHGRLSRRDRGSHRRRRVRGSRLG